MADNTDESGEENAPGLCIGGVWYRGTVRPTPSPDALLEAVFFGVAGELVWNVTSLYFFSGLVNIDRKLCGSFEDCAASPLRSIESME